MKTKLYELNDAIIRHLDKMLLVWKEMTKFQQFVSLSSSAMLVTASGMFFNGNLFIPVLGLYFGGAILLLTRDAEIRKEKGISFWSNAK